MSDCPACGMNCGDTCYRPIVDPVTKVQIALGKEITGLKQQLSNQSKLLDMAEGILKEISELEDYPPAEIRAKEGLAAIQEGRNDGN